jgi:hypothetical protein
MADDFRELFRYQKHDELRIYKLKVLPGGAELWRTTERSGQEATSIKEDDFAHSDEAVRTLAELEERLKAGGWRQC